MSGEHNVNHGDHEEIQVEIEHITGDENDIDTEGTHVNTISEEEIGQSVIGSNGGLNMKEPSAKSVAAKRTIILPHQRKILEDFFKTGMNSASHQLRHLHEAAADQTGLELNVIKNWVRNRRRPIASQKRQEMQQLLLVTGSAASGTPSQIPPTPPVSVVTTVPSLPPVVQSRIQTHTPLFLPTPEPKRQRIDDIISFIVKVRIADSEETDFVEVELESMSYAELLKCSCEELGLSITDVLKIRKLPNVLVRKDRDVGRLTEGQELEIVLKNSYMANNTYTLPGLINFSAEDSGSN